ncbi:MAG: AAA family ATPase [Clostridiaceae bacterium]|jgi:predicted kinase|nr:AAA family ATPase [Clostridiaceae bacterium]
MKAVIFTGLQASGKTTFFKQYFENEYVHVNLDTLKTRNKERLLLEECFEKNLKFVVDNTNPTRENRQRYISLAKEKGYKVIGYYFKSDINGCLKRNAIRNEKNIPDKALFATHKKLEIPSFEEGFDELYYVHITDTGFKVEDWTDEV